MHPCTATPRRKSSPLPNTATSPFATQSCACATPDSIPSPAAARKFSTTKSATKSRASSALPPIGYNVHRTAHQIGMRTTATMMFGAGENYEHRVNHLQALYDLQEETGGFTAFIPWSFQPHNTALGGRHWDEATAVDYLKVLAISRLYLTNFLNVQSSWVTQGLKVCQMGLRFGGNDVGSVMLEENVVKAAGVNNCTTEEELRRIIRDAGFRPAQRDTLYRQYFLN